MLRSDPCFSCVLPECDEASSRCMLRRAAAMAQAKYRHGREAEISPAERHARRTIHRIWLLEDAAKRSEAQP